MITLPKIILASASPRRAEILRIANWPFETLPVNIDETRRPGEPAAAYVERLAREKAETAAARTPRFDVVGADTTVAVDGHILEKPIDRNDAARMLRLLSDRWHEVLTGVAIVKRDTSDIKVARQRTEVKFAAMSDQEIEMYVATGEPMDKAGAYAIQGVGARYIEQIRGEYFNVMGLPLRLLYELLTKPESHA